MTAVYRRADRGLLTRPNAGFAAGRSVSRSAAQFMVDPDKRHSLTALQLMKAYISGPQDLTLADGANDVARRCGPGSVGQRRFSTTYTGPVRSGPSGVCCRFERTYRVPFVLDIRRAPLGALADALAARLRPNQFHREAIELIEDRARPRHDVGPSARSPAGNGLQPVYDTQSLAWLLDQTARKTRQGTLRMRAVFDGERRLIGWYLYYVQEGGVSEVVQVAARTVRSSACWNGSWPMPGDTALWQCVGASTRRHVHGAFGPALLAPARGSMDAVHSHDAEVATAIQQGDAFLSRLEGEWCCGSPTDKRQEVKSQIMSPPRKSGCPYEFRCCVAQAIRRTSAMSGAGDSTQKP